MNSAPHSFARNVRPALQLMLIYGACAGVSIYLSREPGNVANVWYANAVAVAYLCRASRVQLPWLVAAVCVANVGVNGIAGFEWHMMLLLLPGNLVEIGLAAWLLRRAGLHAAPIRTPMDYLRLLSWGALVPPMAGASVAAASLHWVDYAPFAVVWLSWFEGAALGAVSMLLLAMNLLPIPRAAWRVPAVSWPSLAMAALSVGSTLLFMGNVRFPFVYSAFPLLVGAMLFDVVVVAALALVVSVTMTVSLAVGVFVPPPVTAEWQQLFVYLAMAATLIPAQLLACALSESRDQQAALAARERELRLANEGLQQFLRISSHDLREPINTIAQFTALLESDHGGALTTEGRRYVGIVHSSAQRMRGLLDDVMEMVKAQSLQRESLTAVPLDAVMQKVRQSLEASIRASEGSLQVGELPVVRGHPEMLTLLFAHLVENGFKFVAAGTRPAVSVTATLGHNEVLVEVRDNGIGIGAQDLPRLFKPFSRLNLRREYEGSGLGLALCQQVALVHGGGITVESEPGAGSRFIVQLQRPPRGESQPRETSIQPSWSRAP